MIEYVLPIAIFLALGAVSGIILTIAARVLAVKSDEKVEQVLGCLPNGNCGACGFSGCEGYAKAVAAGEAPTNLCKPGGANTAAAVAAAMGVEAEAFVKEYAFVRCNGSCAATQDKYDYIGTASCTAAEKFYKGKGMCVNSCSGLGDCIAVCDNDAITIENGVAVINPSKCGACGKCVAICPNHLISLRKETQTVIVRCSSNDTGKVTRAICKNGCIACKICEKKCPSDAIHVVNNHAEIDPAKCTSCGACADACPVKCIVKLPVCGK